jgi:hypothetical protein
LTTLKKKEKNKHRYTGIALYIQSATMHHSKSTQTTRHIWQENNTERSQVKMQIKINAIEVSDKLRTDINPTLSQ